MPLRVAVEGAIAPPSSWVSMLDLTEADFASLLSSGVFVSSTRPGSVRLAFVGAVLTERGAVLVLPKFCPPGALSFATLLRILRHYFARSEGRVPVETEAKQLHFRDEGVIRDFDTFHSLVGWWRERGTYRQESRTASPFGLRPDWRRTFVRGEAMVAADSVLFPRPISSRRSSSPSIFGALQLYFIKSLGAQYGYAPTAELEGEIAGSVPLAVEPTSPAAARHYALLVGREREHVFRTDRLQLLDVLSRLLTKMEGLSGSRGPQVYGTTAFYLVWEDACRHFFSSFDASPLAEIAQPTWLIYRGTEFETEMDGGKQQPDIMLKFGGQSIILDAKYYFPFPLARPGWGDIVKQIYYRESLPSAGMPAINAFIMPGDTSDDFLFRGIVRVRAAAARDFPDIECWTLNPFMVLDSYASAEASDPSGLPRFLRARALISEVLL